MGFFEFVLAVIIVGTIAKAITGGMKTERVRMKAQAYGYGEEADQLRGVVSEMHHEIGKLRERVRVLEKLMTDDDRRLADEIERLRRTDNPSRL
ncbi:MAG: hypothetical protein EOP61_21595 [Sphingomonadales bacterium]|nr:MAG: hypothetical protein EOP61_21595 [Sphingomonadales bacterium]